MSLASYQRLFGTVLFLSLPIVFSGGCSTAPETSLQKPTIQNEPKKEVAQTKAPKELDEAVQKLILSLRDGNAEGFLGIASKDGVSFGIDSDPIPFLQIQEQIHRKRGVYCFLFDTDCLRKEELLEWKKAKHSGNIEAVISLREALQLASSRKIHISPSGAVTWKLELRAHPAANMINATTFGFGLEENSWRLGSVEYP